MLPYTLMLALCALALVAVSYVGRDSLAPWTFWIAGLGVALLVTLIGWLAVGLLLDIAAAGF